MFVGIGILLQFLTCTVRLAKAKQQNRRVPPNHFTTIVNWNIRSRFVVIRTEMAIRCPHPFIKAMFQRKILVSMSQMPALSKYHFQIYIRSS